MWDHNFLMARLWSVAGPPPYPEGGYFLVDDARSTWFFVMENPTPQEVEAVRTKPLTFNLVLEPPAVSMIVESQVFSAERTLLARPHQRLKIPASTSYDVVLINAQDARVLATRSVVIGRDFADRVVRAMNEQARVPIDQRALTRAEALLASRSVKENVKRAVAAHFVAGDSSPSTFRPPTDADGPQPHPDARPSWDVGPGPGRPFELVRRYGTFYPGIWQQVDALRQARWWPRWCFLPIAQARKLDNGRPVSHHNIDKIVNAAVLLASWRLSKGVYVFNHDFLRDLKGTELGSIPTESVFRMPEQCVYIPVSWPPASHPIGEVHGFFAQLQLNDRDAIPQLALCFDTADGGLWSWIDLIPNSKLDWPDDELAAMTRRGAAPAASRSCRPSGRAASAAACAPGSPR